ncbi:hypothetical protein ABK864_03590 [Serratia marcescens]|uniref:hypothetical protein n=1 Tax=Serratia TaxID=613 RepID=UPI00217A242A|nr:hypothetical protein [Serratia quinivorans]CAI0910418.1 Uncharacterised protein [Serratia quinivorans]CAI2095860.1 Uncharacterised protein [Serratia quinivorans]
MIGRRNPKEYVSIIAEVFPDPQKKRGRLHPVEGQGFPTDMYIECSKAIRELKIGTKVRLDVVVKNPKDGEDRPHLYSSYKWDYEIVV